MVLFFFYKNLSNIDLIKKINNSFTINDGYILIENYNYEDNILTINNNSAKNNIILHGKIVNFNDILEDVLLKINRLDFFNKESSNKFTLDNIWVTKNNGYLYKAYIIY
jgi:predicted transcriptional regulator